MNKGFLKSGLIKIIGWLVGLITATLCNYFLIPFITNITGLKLIALIVGLVIGLFLMMFCVTAAQHFVDVLGKRNGTPTPVKSEAPIRTLNRSSLRLIIPLISGLLILAIIGSDFADMMLSGKSTRISPALAIGLILGLITAIFVVSIVWKRFSIYFYDWYEIFSQ